MLVLAVVAWMLVRPHAGDPASDKDAAVPPLVTVVVPALGAVTSKVSLTGLISARNDMPIGNEGDTGRIAEVLVEAGDRVRKGQVLARLNPITAQSQLDSAEASLDEVRANAAVAQSEWARAQQGDGYLLEGGKRAPSYHRADRPGKGKSRASAGPGCAQQAGANHHPGADRRHRAHAHR